MFDNFHVPSIPQVDFAHLQANALVAQKGFSALLLKLEAVITHERTKLAWSVLTYTVVRLSFLFTALVVGIIVIAQHEYTLAAAKFGFAVVKTETAPALPARKTTAAKAKQTTATTVKATAVKAPAAKRQTKAKAKTQAKGFTNLTEPSLQETAQEASSVVG